MCIRLINVIFIHYFCEPNLLESFMKEFFLPLFFYSLLGGAQYMPSTKLL